MNEEMLKEQIAQMQTEMDLMRKELNYLKPIQALHSPCMKLHNARITMNEKEVIKAVEEIERFFRDENYN